MVQQNVLELAQQGNIEAIANLLNRSLEPKGINAKLGLKEGCLFVSLVSEEVLPQVKLVPFIRSAVISIGAESIKTIKIYGRQVEQTTPAWQEVVELEIPTPKNLKLAPASVAIEKTKAMKSKMGVPTAPFSHPNHSVQLQGEIGQLAIGNYNIQIGSIHGGVVNIISAEHQPRLWTRPTPVFLLPKPFPNLLGRKEEVSLAIANLQSKQSVEFYSQPGLGKTVLLRHLGDQPQATSPFPDGAVSFFTHHQTLTDLLQSIFDAFYESDIAYKPTPTQTRQLLQAKQALILLDEEQLTQSQLEELFNAVPSSTFLVASAERHLWGEGKSVMLHGLPKNAALALVERELEHSLTPEEYSAAESLWKILAGHPQRLLYATGKVREEGCSLTEIVRQVKSTAPTESLIQQILASLSERQRLVIAVLAALGGVALLAQQTATLAGVPEVEAILEQLLRRNLIQVEGLRYRLSESLLVVLQQKWDLNPWQERILSYFTTWAQQYRLEPNRLLAEADAIRHSLAWGMEVGRWTEVLQLVKAVESAIALDKQWGLWEQLLQWGLTAAQAIGDQAAEGWAWHQLGSRALCLEDATTAYHSLSQALQLRESLGDEVGAAVTRHNLSLLLPPTPEIQNQSQATVQVVSPTKFRFPLWLKGVIGLLFLTLGGMVILWGLPVNQKPVATDDQATVVYEKPTTINVLDNDRDSDDEQLTVTIEAQPSNGSAVVNDNGTVTYTPNPDFSGTDEFRYTISDGRDGTDTATVTVTVKEPVNNPPVADDDSVTTNYSQPITINVLDNDNDSDGNQLTVTIETQPSNGSVEVNDNGTVTYTPNSDFSGTDEFRYRISDGRDGTDTAIVRIAVQKPNNPPVAQDNRATTKYSQPITIDVLSNDNDPDGEQLTVTIEAQPSNGSAVVNDNGTVTYTPNSDFSGTDEFRYRISDGRDGTDTAIVRIAVQKPNNPPVAQDNRATTKYSQPITIDVLSNDNDPDGEQLTVTIEAQPSNGSAVVNDNGTVTYTPNPDFSGIDRFTYTISDSRGGTDTAIVRVVVGKPPNNPPVAKDDSVTTNYSQSIKINVLDNDSDPDGDQLTITSATQPSNGSVVVNDQSTITYSPNRGFYGTDKFTYTISDSRGGTSTTTVTVSVKVTIEQQIVY